MKKLLVVGMLFLLISSSCISISGVDTKQTVQSLSSGKTLYVGGSGEGNYTKIQDAIDNSSHGDTVYVYNGTYYESLKITKSIRLNSYSALNDLSNNSPFAVVFVKLSMQK